MILKQLEKKNKPIEVIVGLGLMGFGFISSMRRLLSDVTLPANTATKLAGLV